MRALIDLHVRSLLFFSYFKGNRSVSTDFSKNFKIQKFTELLPVGVAELNAERPKDVTTDGQDKVGSR